MKVKCKKNLDFELIVDDCLNRSNKLENALQLAATFQWQLQEIQCMYFQARVVQR